ncbi:MAG: hypothetical protein VX493_05765 [Candidatus Thermoplasmatota archaeon]|nr:hypothetical protein [Candidatus Thermoplasmatota archaeon]
MAQARGIGCRMSALPAAQSGGCCELFSMLIRTRKSLPSARLNDGR